MSIQLYHGGAVATLREHVASAFVDLVYLDPPFGNGLEWSGVAGNFSDKHEWNAESIAAEQELAWEYPMAAELVRAFTALKPADRAYLVKMAQIFAELRRVLKPTGTVWLHCDDTMGHYLRVLLSWIFGADRDLGAVIWKRTQGGHSDARSFGRIHDSIYVFARSRAANHRLARIRGEFVHGDPLGDFFIEGFAEDYLNSKSKERVGYPTQKPVALIERFVRCATLPGAIVLDPVCGSGTTLVAARRLGRRAIGIDISADAIAVARKRLYGDIPLLGKAEAA